MTEILKGCKVSCYTPTHFGYYLLECSYSLLEWYLGPLSRLQTTKVVYKVHFTKKIESRLDLLLKTD